VTFTVLSLFPEIVDAYFATSIMAKAIEKEIIGYRSINIRDYAIDKHHKCDDPPYGGGAGMLMLPEPLGRALDSVLSAGADTSPNDSVPKKARVVYLTPSGKTFNQEYAQALASEQEVILICGRYEGLDQRIIDTYVDDEISVGDYVLSSGEVAALTVIDAVYRLVDGVIKGESLAEESFSGGLLEYPQYTRPELYGNLRVPEVLLSGHHEQIRLWRLRKRVEKTLRFRPDLIRSGIVNGTFDAETRAVIQEFEGVEHERD